MIGTLVRIHLRWLVAAREVLATLLLYAAAITLAALLTLHDTAQAPLAAASTLWLVLTVAGLLAASRLITAEHASGGLRGLLLAPLERRDVYVSRVVTTALVVGTMILATWGLLIPLFSPLPGLLDPRLAAPLAVGALGFGVLGTFTGWATLETRGGELIASLIAIPLAAPLIIGGFHASYALVAQTPAWEASLTFATGYVVAVGALTYLVADPVMEAP